MNSDHECALTHLSREEFDERPPSLRVIVHNSPTRFASLALGGGGADVALSWRSEGVEPNIDDEDPEAVWIGVDQRVVCLARDGRVLFSAGVWSRVVEIRRGPRATAILGEVDLLLVRPDFTVAAVHGLPDLAVSVEPLEGRWAVTLFDRSIVEVSSE